MVGLLRGMRDAGKTIFVVTHQATLLEGVADEFVWMQSGQIVDRTHHLAPDHLASDHPASDHPGSDHPRAEKL
jgi:ABC-type siderophore export system fused ATPase/permease subunit